MREIDAHTRLVTLLGYPIEHTLSPHIHNTAFEHQDLNYIYTASEVRPPEISDAVAGIRALGFAGANVTIPHKEKILPLLDDLTEAAAAVGAVNTIIPRHADGETTTLKGDNTDIAGFLSPLNPYHDTLKGERFLVFGSGGASRAVVYALITTFSPQTCVIAARTPEKAERISRDLSAHDSNGSLQVCPLTEAGPFIRSSRLLVNATPVGMHPDTDTSIWPNPTDMHADQIAYDLVYRPRKTRWLREAKQRGAVIIGGLQMLIAQAAASYKQWTGNKMPLPPVERALDNL